MNALAIVLRGQPQPYVFYFKKYDDAMRHQEVFLGSCQDDTMATFVDDYGHRAVIRISDVIAVLATDVARDFDAQIDMMKVRRTAEAKAQSQGTPNLVLAHPGGGRQQ